MAKQVDKEQLDIASKLSILMDRMALSAERSTDAYESQVNAMKEIASAVGKINTQEANSQIDELSSKIKEFASDSEFLEDINKNSFASLQAGSKLGVKGMATLAKGMLQGTTVSAGFGQSVKNILASGKSITSWVATFVGGLVSIGMAIIAIPFKFFDALIDTADKANVNFTELRQAIENIRKEFGALTGPTPKAIRGLTMHMEGFKETGLSTWRVFGNMAERLNYIRELATEMGSTFQRLRGEFINNGGAILAYQKGLGLANEQMKAVASRSISMGVTVASSLKDIAKHSLGMSKAFGIDAKLISRDMGKAMQDVQHFANLTGKEISIAATYARGLGVELSNITGVLDSFETFDTAADNAARLSEAFGANVDAFKLMAEQNPGKQIDMLRTAFKNAGQDSSTFSRQQLKMIENTTHLSAETARQVFSLKNQGLSYDQVAKKAAESEKKTMTQTEAMSKLADSIERLVKSPMGPGGGFFDHFVSGLMRGFQSSQGFRQTIMFIHRDLTIMLRAGVQVGRAFATMFPGVKEIFGNLADMFNPRKFKVFASGIKNVFIKFFEDLKYGNGSFSDLMTGLQKTFFNFFDTRTAAGQRVVEGFKTFIRTVGSVLAQGIKWAGVAIADGMKSLTSFLKNPKDFMSGLNPTGFLNSIFGPIVVALSGAWDVIGPAAMEMITVIVTKTWDFAVQKFNQFTKSKFFEEKIAPNMKYLYAGIAALMFGPAFGAAIITMFISTIGKSLTSGTGMISKIISGPLSAIAKSPAIPGVDSLETPTAAVGKVGKLIAASKSIGITDAIKLGLKLMAIATAIRLGGPMIATAIKLMKDELAGVTFADASLSIGILAGVALASVPLMAALKIAANFSIGSSLKGLAVIGLTLGGLSLISLGIAHMLKNYAPASLDAAGTFMMKMTEVFLGMIPLIVGATALGVAVMFTGGVPLAIGLAAITASFAAIATTSIAMMREINKLNILSGFKEKATIFTQIFQSIGSFVTTLSSVMKIATPSISELLSGKGSFGTKLQDMQQFIRGIIGEKGSSGGMIGIIETISQAITQVSTTTVTGNTAALMNIFSSIINLIGSISNSKLTQSTDSFQASKAKYSKIVESIPDFGRIIGGIAKSIGPLFDSLKNIITLMPADKSFNSKIEVTQKLFSFISKIPELANSLKGLSTGSTIDAKTVSDQLSNSILGISTFLESIVSTGGDGQSKQSLLGGLFKSIDDVAVAVSGKDANKIVKTFNTISKIFGAADSSTQSLNAFLGSVKNSANNINDSSQINAGTAIGSMITAISEIDKALSGDNVGKIDLTTKLSKFAKAAGLGGKGSYTITNKAVNINVSFTVYMSVSETEKIMLTQQKSIIRDRLNKVGETVPQLNSDAGWQIKSGNVEPTNYGNKG